MVSFHPFVSFLRTSRSPFISLGCLTNYLFDTSIPSCALLSKAPFKKFLGSHWQSLLEMFSYRLMLPSSDTYSSSTFSVFGSLPPLVMALQFVHFWVILSRPVTWWSKSLGGGLVQEAISVTTCFSQIFFPQCCVLHSASPRPQGASFHLDEKSFMR